MCNCFPLGGGGNVDCRRVVAHRRSLLTDAHCPPGLEGANSTPGRHGIGENLTSYPINYKAGVMHQRATAGQEFIDLLIH